MTCIPAAQVHVHVLFSSRDFSFGQKKTQDDVLVVWGEEGKVWRRDRRNELGVWFLGVCVVDGMTFPQADGQEDDGKQ